MATSAAVLDSVAEIIEALTPTTKHGVGYRRWRGAGPEVDSATDRAFTLTHRTAALHTEHVATNWKMFSAELRVYYALARGVESRISEDGEQLETALLALNCTVAAVILSEAVDADVVHEKDEHVVYLSILFDLTYSTTA